MIFVSGSRRSGLTFFDGCILRLGNVCLRIQFEVLEGVGVRGGCRLVDMVM